MSSLPPGQVPLNKASIKRSATHPADACTYRSVSILKEAPVLSEIRPVIQKDTPVLAPSTKRVKTWHVSDDSLQLLPPYPLEKTKVTVDMKSATPSIIAARISEALRKMSVEATFDDKMATAFLVTECQVQMNISLFKDEENEGTVVEVQRMQGCGAVFHRYTRCILSAAQGLTTEETQQEPSFTLPQCVRRENIFCEQKELKNVLLALELVDSLLRLDQADSSRLGMESLSTLTQPDKSSAKAAELVAKVVLSGSVSSAFCGSLAMADEGSNQLFERVGTIGPNIRDAVMDLILGDSNDEWNDDEISLKAQVKPLRRLALAVFANSLEFTSKNARVEQTAFDPPPHLNAPELVAALVETLKQADVRPCDACLAAKCLGLLLQVSSDARKCSHAVNALPIIRMAFDVGCKRHAKLQRETEGLLRIAV